MRRCRRGLLRRVRPCAGAVFVCPQRRDRSVGSGRCRRRLPRRGEIHQLGAERGGEAAERRPKLTEPASPALKVRHNPPVAPVRVGSSCAPTGLAHSIRRLGATLRGFASSMRSTGAGKPLGDLSPRASGLAMPRPVMRSAARYTLQERQNCNSPCRYCRRNSDLAEQSSQMQIHCTTRISSSTRLLRMG